MSYPRGEEVDTWIIGEEEAHEGCSIARSVSYANSVGVGRGSHEHGGVGMGVGQSWCQ